jgi:serine protease Do
MDCFARVEFAENSLSGLTRMRSLSAIVILLCSCAICAFAAHFALPRLVRQTPVGNLPDFVSVARRFDPSLVHISTLYRETLPGAPADAGAAGGRRAGLGSGIILQSDGHILTNDHVIANAEKIFVKLANRRELVATVVGRDARSDLALIKVAAPHPLTGAPLGDSERLRTGEWVVALGSPFGLDRTLTAGIVSAKTRRLATNAYCDFIQTDVTINPGNSGGPLLNLHGLVVGLNTAIVSRNGTNTGINFAIPVNLIKDVLPELFSKGRISRGWVGISTQTISQATARQLRLDKASGALVVGVAPDGPAAHAGIRPGDVVVAYDGTSVDEAGELPALVAKTAVGRNVSLYLSRNRILYRAVLAVGELKESSEAAAPPARFYPDAAMLSLPAAVFPS